MVFGGGSAPAGAFGPQGGPPSGGRDPQEVPTECAYAQSEFRIEINMSGGPQHQIPYCWDKNVGDGRSNGKYINPPSRAWNNGTWQHRWCEPDDMYQGAFKIKRELLTSGTSGGCGNQYDPVTGELLSTDCPEADGCCEDNSFGGAGKTLMGLSWEVYQYGTPAPQSVGNQPPAHAPIMNKIEDGIKSFDLCKADEVEELKRLKERLEPLTHTHQIRLTATITSVNSRQKCFRIENAADAAEEKLAWLGGQVDGNNIWREVKQICDISTGIQFLAAIGGVGGLLCERLVGGSDENPKCKDNKGEVGFFLLNRRMPTGCPKPKPRDWYNDGAGPSNWFAVRQYGGQPLRILHDDSSPPFWEHGESDNPEYTARGKQGTRENILAIIDAVIGNPSDRLCGFHKMNPLNILLAMGHYGNELLCVTTNIKIDESTNVRKQPVNVGMAWCLSAVRKLLGG